MGELEEEKEVKFGIIANPRKGDLPHIFRELRDRVGIENLIYSDDLIHLLLGDERALPIEQIADEVDVILSFGGDGTFLKASRYSKGKPIAGVNLGGLGFLTIYRREELGRLLENLLKGNYRTEERLALEARKEDGKKFFALNDVTVIVTGSSRMIDLEISVESEILNRYRADGVIVSTPTGSTAYNLASGGPIVHPGVLAYVVTPICAHTLSVRSVIVPAELKLYIVARSKGEKILLSADGQDEALLKSGERVEIRTLKGAVKMVKTPDTLPFFEILRTKLGWG